MDCKTCRDVRAGDTVPFRVHEADMARMERANQRAWILCIVLAAMLLGSWAGFLIYEAQFETVTETTTEEYEATTDGGGVAINNRGGEVNYGYGQVQEDDYQNLPPEENQWRK